ncbi:MAG: carboxymuconolactone decarboxylase family protein [Solirubrobacteraceae bacterium]|nr:carboxymuconolactone decarboxylase family protein [Solirubrobacteraceae bacterium]
MKTAMSRFPVHDELTAPPASLPVLRGAMSTAGQLPNFLAVLAGSPAALRGYVRLRGELRNGTLPKATLERISLAIAEHHGSEPGIALHTRTARAAGLGMDEIARARRFDSEDPREAALLRLLHALVTQPGPPPIHLHEEALESDWTSEQILEAIAYAALETFTAFVNVAGNIPVDGSTEETRLLRAA